LQRLAQRAAFGLGGRDALAAVLGAQPAAQFLDAARGYREVGAGAVGVEELGAAVVAPDLAYHAGHRADQMLVPLQHLLRGERAVPTVEDARLAPRGRLDRAAGPFPDQSRVAAGRALRARPYL